MINKFLDQFNNIFDSKLSNALNQIELIYGTMDKRQKEKIIEKLVMIYEQQK